MRAEKRNGRVTNSVGLIRRISEGIRPTNLFPSMTSNLALRMLTGVPSTIAPKLSELYA